jgi:predicted secreted protein
MSTNSEEVPSRLELHPGEEYAVELPGLATAGYRWEHELDPVSGVVDVTWRRGTLPLSSPPAMGASAPEIVIIRAVEPGEVKLRLVQRRHWNRKSPPVDSHDIEIVVAGRSQ